jgi:hypothetical protein
MQMVPAGIFPFLANTPGLLRLGCMSIRPRCHGSVFFFRVSFLEPRIFEDRSQGLSGKVQSAVEWGMLGQFRKNPKTLRPNSFSSKGRRRQPSLRKIVNNPIQCYVFVFSDFASKQLGSLTMDILRDLIDHPKMIDASQTVEQRMLLLIRKLRGYGIASRRLHYAEARPEAIN